MFPRILDVRDISAFVDHITRHGAESGNDGDIIFMPADPPEPEPLKKKVQAQWTRAAGESEWGRAFGVFDGDQLIAHADLRARELPSELHRAWFGLGVERAYRQRGLGRALTQTALAWARESPPIDWVDLSVFAKNVHAIRLYELCGFQHTGRVADRFRVRGESIEDLSMTLYVGEGEAPLAQEMPVP